MSDHSDQERRSPHEPDTLPPDIAQRARRLLIDLAKPERKGYVVLALLLIALTAAADDGAAPVRSELYPAEACPPSQVGA